MIHWEHLLWIVPISASAGLLIMAVFAGGKDPHEQKENYECKESDLLRYEKTVKSKVIYSGHFSPELSDDE